MTAKLVIVARWTARLLGAGLLGLLLMFLIGEGPPNPARLSPAENAMMVSLLVALAGFVLLWFREFPGGLASLGGIGAFYAIHFCSSFRFPGGWVFPLFFLPGLLALVSWSLRRESSG